MGSIIKKIIIPKDLLEAIIQLKKEYYVGLAEHLLEYKWRLGEMLSIARVQQETYKEVEKKTGINTTEQSRCINFYNKYIKKDYLPRPWREHIKELGPAESKKDDGECCIHVWQCIKCKKTKE